MAMHSTVATPDVRLETLSKIEIVPTGMGSWEVSLTYVRGAVLCGTNKYPARSVEEAVAIAKTFMDEEGNAEA